MSSQRHESDLIREWLDETYAAERDPRRFHDHVIEAVPSTPQRRLRWWHRISSRRTQRPSTTDTTGYRPNPIPAANGQTPTVIGRTTSMLSPVKAITAGALVFAIGGAFLIAQPFGQQGSVPGANDATTEPSPPVIVTGNWLGVGEPVQEPVETEVDGVSQGRGGVIGGEQSEADDPRLTGDVTSTVNADLRTVEGTLAFLQSISLSIENDQGSWSGLCDALVIADGRADPFTCLISGEGAYEGLSAYLVFENPEQPPFPFEGLIFEGDVPPTPEIRSAE